MEAYAGWWILAAVLVGLELGSGTFYLLVYGVAAAAAGVAAWFGASFLVQLLSAGAVALLGKLLLNHWKRDTGHPEASVQDLDIGQTVQLESWQDGRGQVRYRGALWDAEAQSAAVDSARPLVIRAVRGNVLVVGN